MQAASAYVQQDTYQNAIDKLEAIARNFDPAAPDMLRSAIIQVLGEELGLWPVDCLTDQIPRRLSKNNHLHESY